MDGAVITTPRTKLEWALRLADEGFGILQLSPGSKKPTRGFGWLKSLTTNADTIRGWFDADPDVNYGVCPGSENVILDVDIKEGKDGYAHLIGLTLEANHGDLAPTFTVETPSGGKHMYFKTPVILGNTHAFEKDAGIDVRGAHGYVVGPGCELVEGLCGAKDTPGPYEVTSDDVEIAPVDKWLLTKFLKKKRDRDNQADKPMVPLDLQVNLDRALSFLIERNPAIEGRNGDDHTYKTMAFLRDFGVSEAKALELCLSSGWNDRCVPPWDLDELSDRAEHVYRHAQNRPGSKADLMGMFEEMIAPQALAEFSDYSDRIFHGDTRENSETNPDLFPAYLVGELDQIPDPTWLIRDVLPEAALGMTYGETGSLKTFLELDKALWGAKGLPWAASEMHGIKGFEPTRPIRTVIVAGEGARGLKRRIAAWAKRHEIDTRNLAILVVPVMPLFKNNDDVEKLIQTVKAKLPNPDHVVVDTAMWAAAGLNLSLPADSQILLSAFKHVMQSLRCSLTFVHHTGKDHARGHLGAENLLAGVDIADKIELAEKGIGRRTIKVTNCKMKDGEIREKFFMEASPESLGTDTDGHNISSLVLRRCHRIPGKAGPTNPKLMLAHEILSEHKGEKPLPMNALATEMARRYAAEELTDEEFKRSKEGMRNFLRKKAKGELASYYEKGCD